MKKILFVFFISFLFLVYPTYSKWYPLNSRTTNNLNCIHFVNMLTGFIAGEVLLKTTNGGLNWDTKIDSLSGLHIIDIDFINPNVGFFVSDYLTSFKTTDSGETWSSLGFYPAVTEIFQVRFVNEQTGFVTAGVHAAPYVPYHYLYKTTNGGNNWNIIMDIGFDCTEFIKIGNDTLLFSDYSVIKKSVNGGAGWSSFILPNPEIKIFDCDNIQNLICKNRWYGNIYRTTNFGNNWQDMGASTISKGFVNKDQSAFGISVNSVYKSYNTGQNWNIQLTQNNYINDIKFINNNIGFICGSNGIIYKTTNGGEPIGITTISSQIPDQFSLSQNYPNPFNPSTKIKFQIPASGTVAQTFLSVYDILGREVATLVNQQLQPGTYEVDWDASAYPSGVYFYKLNSGDFTETKKMVFIK